MNSNSDAETVRIPGFSELESLVEAIEHESQGKVRALLEHSINANLASSAVKIMSSGAGRGSYELMQVRALDFQYPVVLEVMHFDDEHRISKLTDSSALKRSLIAILDDVKTKKIIQLFADEAVPRIETSEPRPFLVAEKPFNHVGTLMTHVAFLGFGGFLSIETMQRLARDPDSDGAAMQTFGNKYVATFSFVGDIKVTLSKEEMLSLQRNARSIIDSANPV